MSDQTPFIVEPIHENMDEERWTPAIGSETMAFLDRAAPQDGRDNLCNAAVSILSQGINPANVAGQKTGLVVGYVQSGKTLSFETVATLARDNGFQVVIVVTGISNLLLEQSTDRLRRDLALDQLGQPRRWVEFKNPSYGESIATIQEIRNVLEDWRDPGMPEGRRKTILITVLKHHQHLRNLARIFGEIEMSSVPVLIIDDEADQASLNIEVRQGEESTTYQRLMTLREQFPLHTYLQYTATPQAPLLVSIIDSLSPDFVQVLEPGSDYVGGKEFFADSGSGLRVIPSEDVPVQSNPLSEVPESLIKALRVFMIGVTVGLDDSGDSGNRSMLVHPSHRTSQHQDFHNWVKNIIEEWKRTFALPDLEPDRKELVEEFREAYDDLKKTTESNLPAFDDLVGSFTSAFRNTRVLEVNARDGKTPEVDWQNAYGWILVGGQAMDRGFTVEGLTVTYMPRGIGGGNADTVQQRARFFGYKKSYFGYCRIYLEEGTLHAFQSYVDHEEDIRRQLIDIQNGGQRLSEWRRAFVLDPALKPCRHSVLEFDYIRGQLSDSWFRPRVILAGNSVIKTNRKIVEEFLKGKHFVDNDGHPDRTEIQRHRVCREMTLRSVMEQLLVHMQITSFVDSQQNIGMLLQLSQASENDPNELCSVYQISPSRRRERSVREDGEISELFQGESPVERERRGEIYPGDRAIHDGDRVTVQIHTLDLTKSQGGNKEIIMENVPVIAVWVPRRLARAWVVQDQPAQDS